MVARAEHFIPRLQILDTNGALRTLDPLYPEQWTIVETFLRYQQMLIVKPRQIGCTTITQALMFWWAFWAPKANPVDVLTIGHEQGSCDRVNRMLRHYALNLPTPFRPALTINNGQEIQLGHNGSTFRQLMAGGRGQGKSYTYQALSLTEVAYFPTGSAAAKGTTVDRDIVHSALATVHRGPYRKVVMESTGNGPEGVFWDYAQLAYDSPEWGFVAMMWYDFPTLYALPAQDFIPRPEELELAAQYGLTMEQLAWRRDMLEVQGYTLLRFRREFPEQSWKDPFLAIETKWYDQELLQRLIHDRIGYQPPVEDGLVVYHEWEPGREFFIGVDTSGGSGRDYAVVYVVRDDFTTCARWSSNTTDTDLQADWALKLSNMYGRAEICTERNHFGGAVIERLEDHGGNTWKDEKGDDWWTQAGKAGETKRELLVWTRRLVREQIAVSLRSEDPPILEDRLLAKQMISIREGPDGKIEAPPGKHDDVHMAWALACWCAKDYHERVFGRSDDDEPEHVLDRLNRWGG